MAEQDLKDKILRIYELMEEISDRKTEIKERNTEMDALYDSIASHLEQSGSTVLETEDGEFELRKSIKFSKRKTKKI